MHIPKHFRQDDRDALLQTIRAIKLGALVIFSENRFLTTQIPFVAKEDSRTIILEGHVSRVNEIWKHASQDNKAMVIFQGPHAYIHPGWYATKAKTGKVVPTWNYQAVHCHGYAENQQSEQWILQHIEELTKENEQNRESPWHIADAPPDYINALIKGIVGIRITVEQIEGALKMNQHHPTENRLGVIEGLSKSPRPADCEIAQMMRKLESRKI
jgi:transcriptional regulator